MQSLSSSQQFPLSQVQYDDSDSPIGPLGPKIKRVRRVLLDSIPAAQPSSENPKLYYFPADFPSSKYEVEATARQPGAAQEEFFTSTVEVYSKNAPEVELVHFDDLYNPKGVDDDEESADHSANFQQQMALTRPDWVDRAVPLYADSWRRLADIAKEILTKTQEIVFREVGSQLVAPASSAVVAASRPGAGASSATTMSPGTTKRLRAQGNPYTRSFMKHPVVQQYWGTL